MIVVVDNTRTQKVKMFLPKLLEFMNEKHIKYSIVKGDVSGIEELKKIESNGGVHGIILTGSPLMLGSATPDEYATNIYCLKRYKKTPILGICFGCQIINTHFGGSLTDLGEVHCKKFLVEEISTKMKFCARYMPMIVPKQLQTVMTALIEGGRYPCFIQHSVRPITGVMFHPEALKQSHFMLGNFLNSIKVCKVT